MKVEIPVAIGELFDKISILNVKKSRISDYPSVTTILHELSLLHIIAQKIDRQYFETKEYKKLFEVNDTLFVIEDSIRAFEKAKQFDENFIALARRVYLQNDKRAKIKSTINLIYNSDITEVKTYQKY